MPTEALNTLNEAVRIQKAALGPDHQDVATTLWNMGGAFLAQGDTARAKETLEEAHRIFVLRLGEDHPDTESVAQWLADSEQ